MGESYETGSAAGCWPPAAGRGLTAGSQLWSDLNPIDACKDLCKSALALKALSGGFRSSSAFAMAPTAKEARVWRPPLASFE